MGRRTAETAMARSLRREGGEGGTDRMTERAREDPWASWLLRPTSSADDAELKEGWVEALHPTRDRVLENARLSGGEILLDVGAGDGLIAFGALAKLGDEGRVIFSDISQQLLDHCSRLAEEAGVADRCRFLRAPATDLSALADASVDAVTTRSVLIYVGEKRRAFEEFYRVLRPGGRLSIFEPVGSFKRPDPPGIFWGYDVAPVRDLAERVRAVYERAQPRDADPMYDFDEQDLLRWAEEVGFEEVRLDYRAEIARGNPPGWDPQRSWDICARIPPNPLVPSLEEAAAGALTPEEAERFLTHLRPLVERGERTSRRAHAYLWATKT